MDSHIVRGGNQRLRSGFTTGTCAAAAAQAAAWALLTGQTRETVRVRTPQGAAPDLPVRCLARTERAVRCGVEKDPGDDPDVTRGTLICAEVSRSGTPGIRIDGGDGVGRVTKPGLDQPVGAAAINSVPRRMIREGVEKICRLANYSGGLDVIISVPGGQELAKKTFNPRLGIEGGISILGTTGIVEPMSERAVVETIRVELRQRRACGAEYALLTPGNYGAAFLQSAFTLPPELAVTIGNFIGDALDICRELGFRGALLVGHVGKLVKLAGGMWNTHSKYGDCRMEILAACAAAEGFTDNSNASGVNAVLECVTCDAALEILAHAGVKDATLRRLTERIAASLNRKGGEGFEIGAALFSNVFGLLGETENARRLLQEFRK